MIIVVKRISLNTRGDFEVTSMGGPIDEIQIDRNEFGMDLGRDDEWRDQYRGLGDEKILISVVGFLKAFKQAYPGFKIEPLALK